jgi:hypothetical protein
MWSTGITVWSLKATSLRTWSCKALLLSRTHTLVADMTRWSKTRQHTNLSLNACWWKCKATIHLCTESDAHVRVKVPSCTAPYKKIGRWTLARKHAASLLTAVRPAQEYFSNTETNIWASKNISRTTKLRIFNSIVKSILLYGAETWRTTKTALQKIQTFYNTCLRCILNIRWPERITNEDLWRRAKQEPIDVQIRRRKWGWIGHTLRKPPSNATR